MTVKKALLTILENSELKSLNYCIDYAAAALQMDEDSHEFEVQILYVLSNMTHWRGPLAQKVRKTLKGVNS